MGSCALCSVINASMKWFVSIRSSLVIACTAFKYLPCCFLRHLLQHTHSLGDDMISSQWETCLKVARTEKWWPATWAWVPPTPTPPLKSSSTLSTAAFSFFESLNYSGGSTGTKQKSASRLSLQSRKTVEGREGGVRCRVRASKFKTQQRRVRFPPTPIPRWTAHLFQGDYKGEKRTIGSIFFLSRGSQHLVVFCFVFIIYFNCQAIRVWEWKCVRTSRTRRSLSEKVWRTTWEL